MANTMTVKNLKEILADLPDDMTAALLDRESGRIFNIEAKIEQCYECPRDHLVFQPVFK